MNRELCLIFFVNWPPLIFSVIHELSFIFCVNRELDSFIFLKFVIELFYFSVNHEFRLLSPNSGVVVFIEKQQLGAVDKTRQSNFINSVW